MTQEQHSTGSAQIWAVVPAAGSGSRMQLDKPKQYCELDGKTILEHSLGRLLSHPQINGVVVALSGQDQYWSGLDLKEHNKPVICVEGGEERCHSVLNGITRLEQEISGDDWVMVHDAARPCVRAADLDKLISQLHDHPVGGILATRVRDTMKRGDVENNIVHTVDRENLWHAQTPQMFRVAVLKSAIQKSLEKGLLITDEASAIEGQGMTPLLVEAHEDNIKVTRQQDLSLAGYYLQAQKQEGP